MLVINPSANYPIEVIDHDSGNKWTVTFFYGKGGRISLGFDCPESVRVFNSARKAKKRNKEENGDKGTS